jgi:hypothetical protein
MSDINQEQPIPTQALVGANELARILDLRPQMIYKMVHLRMIPYIKLGEFKARKARILFNVQDVLAEIQGKYTIPARRGHTRNL